MPEGHRVHLSIRAESFLVNNGTPLMEGEVVRIFVMGKEQLAYLKLQDEMDFAIQSGEYDPTYS